MQHISADGWSDAPLGQRMALCEGDSSGVLKVPLHTYAEATSLYDLVKLLEAAPPRGHSRAAALALDSFAQLSHNVVRGDANAFLMIDGGKHVRSLCDMIADERESFGLTPGVCALALEAVATLATTEVAGSPLVCKDLSLIHI